MLQISNLRRCKNGEMRSSERLGIGVLFRHTTYQAWRTFEWILLAKLTKNHSLYHYGFHPLLVTKPHVNLVYIHLNGTFAMHKPMILSMIYGDTYSFAPICISIKTDSALASGQILGPI